MLDPEEIRWVKSTANELNNLLQVISESSQLLESLSPKTSDGEKYFSILRTGVERATKVTRMMVDRVGGYNAEPAAPPLPPPTMPAPPVTPHLFPPPSITSTNGQTELKIFNSSGPRELVMIVDDEDFVTLLAQRVLAD